MSLSNTSKQLFAALLCLFYLNACGEGAPITAPVHIVAFGDSLTAGYRLPTEESVPAKLQRKFFDAGHTGIRMANMGISGDTTQNGLARLNLVLESKPDIVILELGANDILRQKPAAKARENLAIIIEQLKAQGITVILCGIQVPGIFAIGNQHLGEYKPMFQELADTYDVEFYPNFIAGVQGKSEYNQNDGLHPNVQGTSEIADRLYPIVLDVAQEVVADKAG